MSSSKESLVGKGKGRLQESDTRLSKVAERIGGVGNNVQPATIPISPMGSTNSGRLQGGSGKFSRYSIAKTWEEDQRRMLAGEMEMYFPPVIGPVPCPPQIPNKPPRPYPGMDFVPKRHKAKIVVWADLTVDALDRLSESLNSEHIKHVLADIFVLDNYKESVKTGIVMDLYFYTLQFCREQSFSPEKTSAFFSIIKKIFEVCIETPFGNLDHTFEYFKDLIHCHSINRPPYSIELFTPDEVRKMTEYTINSFFRHFKMYKYAFTPLVRLDLSLNYIGMPPSPPPSESGDKTETSSQMADEVLDENKEEEVDEEKQQAREDLRNMVKNFLGAEAKRIEGNVDNHIKSAVDSLNTQIDNIIGVPSKTDTKAKKK